MRTRVTFTGNLCDPRHFTVSGKKKSYSSFGDKSQRFDVPEAISFDSLLSPPCHNSIYYTDIRIRPRYVTISDLAEIESATVGGIRKRNANQRAPLIVRYFVAREDNIISNQRISWLKKTSITHTIFSKFGGKTFINK